MCNLAVRSVFLSQNHPKNLDPSCKIDLDLLDYLKRIKSLYKPQSKYSTVDSRSLEIEGTLKNTSRYPYVDIRFVVLRKKQFEQPNFSNDYVI